MLIITKSQTYPPFIYVSPYHYEYLGGLAILGEDANRADLGDSTRLDESHFQDMDPVWLRSMWEDGGTAHDDIIENLISLALLKLKSRL